MPSQPMNPIDWLVFCRKRVRDSQADLAHCRTHGSYWLNATESRLKSDLSQLWLAQIKAAAYLNQVVS